MLSHLHCGPNYVLKEKHIFHFFAFSLQYDTNAVVHYPFLKQNSFCAIRFCHNTKTCIFKIEILHCDLSHLPRAEKFLAFNLNTRKLGKYNF